MASSAGKTPGALGATWAILRSWRSLEQGRRGKRKLVKRWPISLLRCSLFVVFTQILQIDHIACSKGTTAGRRKVSGDRACLVYIYAKYN
jgi:hypothetical protein